MSVLGEKASRLAALEVGVRESPLGSNRGVRVEQYQASVGIPPGSAWCAAFVYFNVEHAAHDLHLPNPLPKTGYVPTLRAWAQKQGRVLSEPIPGCLFIVKGLLPGSGKHVGFVVSVEGQYVHTAEGNSNDTGSAEGVGVFALTRRWGPGTRLLFVRV